MAELVEHGLATPSLDAICARAGYTRGAFYVHFEDRDAFNLAVLEHVLGSFLDLIDGEGAHADDLEHTIDRFVGALSQRQLPAHSGRVIDELLQASARSPELRERFLELHAEILARVTRATRRGQASGKLRSDVEPSELATMLVALGLGVLMIRDADVPLEPDRIAAAVLRLLRA